MYLRHNSKLLDDSEPNDGDFVGNTYSIVPSDLDGHSLWPFIEDWLQKRFRWPDGVSVLIGVIAFLGFLVLTVWESFAA